MKCDKNKKIVCRMRRYGVAIVNLGLVSPADATLEHECAEAHRWQDLAVVEDEAMIHDPSGDGKTGSLVDV